MNNKGFIFDLDGVIVDTAHFHYRAWKKTAEELGFNLTEELNEKLKGVSRIESLNIILDWADISISQEHFNNLTLEKNKDYLKHVNQMSKSDVLPGVTGFIYNLKKLGYPVSLGSASKNAKGILQQVELIELFDAIVDGNSVSKAKPDPEVFIRASSLIEVKPEDCVVFEDSQAGIEAANKANMISIGIGNKSILNKADFVFKDFTVISDKFIEELLSIEKKQ